MMAKVIAQHHCAWMHPNASSPACPGVTSAIDLTNAGTPGCVGGDNPVATGPESVIGMRFGFLSFDGAFMNFGPDGFWDRRTFTTRFLMNHSVPAPGVETFRKLSLNVMTPLSKMGTAGLQVVVGSGAKTGTSAEGRADSPSIIRSSSS